MDVGERIAVGFAEAERTRRANVPGAEVLEIDGLVLAFANVPDPPVNSVHVLSERFLGATSTRLAAIPTPRQSGEINIKTRSRRSR